MTRTYFPVKIRFRDGAEMLVKSPEQIPINEPITIIETNVDAEFDAELIRERPGQENQRWTRQAVSPRFLLDEFQKAMQRAQAEDTLKISVRKLRS